MRGTEAVRGRMGLLEIEYEGAPDDATLLRANTSSYAHLGGNPVCPRPLMSEITPGPAGPARTAGPGNGVVTANNCPVVDTV